MIKKILKAERVSGEFLVKSDTFSILCQIKSHYQNGVYCINLDGTSCWFRVWDLYTFDRLSLVASYSKIGEPKSVTLRGAFQIEIQTRDCSYIEPTLKLLFSALHAKSFVSYYSGNEKKATVEFSD